MKLHDKEVNFKRYLKNRLPNNQLKHNGFHEITPYHLLDSLESAKDVISYSNYDCANYDRIIEILIRYCEQNKINIK